MAKILKRRFLSWLILAAVSLIVGNFFLWFMHTRVMTEALHSFKKELSHHDISLKFDDIKSKNLKYWRLEGDVPNIYLEFLGAGSKVFLPHVHFKSMPFEHKVALELKDGWSIIAAPDDETMFATKNSVLEVSLEDSLRHVVSVLQDPEAPKMHLIDTIKYSDEGMHITRRDGVVIGDVTPLMIQGDATRSENEAIMNLKVPKVRFSMTPEYIVQYKNNEKQKLSFTPDFLEFEIDLVYKETPSKSLQALLRNDESGKYKKILNSFQVEFRNISHTNSYYKFIMTGMLDKQPEKILPDIDCNVLVSDYTALALHLKEQHEHALYSMLGSGSSYAIADEKFSKLLKLFEELKPEGKILNLKISSHPSYGFTISGKPIFEVMNDLHNIFSY